MRKLGLFLIVLSFLAFGTGSAKATGVRQCVARARNDFVACRNECTNDLKNDRFLCRNIEAGCGRECLGRRESCIDAATQPLEDCLTGCKSDLNAAKASCRTTCGGDRACLDTCIDTAQVTAFTCRDDCREGFHANGGEAAVAQCRADFRTCVNLCPHHNP